MPTHPEPRNAFGRRLSTPRRNQAVLDIQPQHEESRLDNLELVTDQFLNNVRDLAYAQAAKEVEGNLLSFEAEAEDIITRANAIYNRMLDSVRFRTA